MQDKVLVASITDSYACLALAEELGQHRELLRTGVRADRLLSLLRLSSKVNNWPNALKAVKETTDALFLWIMALDTQRQDIFHEIFPLFYPGNIKIRTAEQGRWTVREGKLESWVVVDDQIRLEINGERLTLPLFEWKKNRRLIMFDQAAVYEAMGSVLWEMRGKGFFKSPIGDNTCLIAAVPDLM